MERGGKGKAGARVLLVPLSNLFTDSHSGHSCVPGLAAIAG